MILTEEDLRFDFSGAMDAMQFDDEEHKLSHCMKAVDFVVEFDAFYLFVEVKDPELPAALLPTTQASEIAARQVSVQKFIAKFTSGTLREELKLKFRDSLIYRWAEERLEKPVHYLVLLELPSVDQTLFGPELQRLRGAIPFTATGMPCRRWRQQVAGECQLHSIATWNAHLPWPVSRVSA